MWDFDYGMEMEALESERLDADLQMAEMAAVGRQIDRVRAEGGCAHTSAVGYLPVPVYPEQVGLEPGQLRCTEGCNRVFADDEDWMGWMDAALN